MESKLAPEPVTNGEVSTQPTPPTQPVIETKEGKRTFLLPGFHQEICELLKSCLVYNIPVLSYNNMY